MKEIQRKYIGGLKGWHVRITETGEQEKENLIIGIILMDKDKYSH